MEFCQKCGAVLIPKMDDKKKRLICGACGYKPRGKKSIILKEKVKLNRNEVIEVRDQKIETLPKTKIECKKCGNQKAYFWMLQTRGGDEPETRFFECTKCKHRWREY